MKELIVREIMYYGLFQNKSQMEDGLEGLKDTEKIEALKAQLRFREQVLEQEAEDQLFRFSRKNETGGRTNLSLEELLKNTLTLIENSLSLEDSGEKTIASLIGKRVQHEFNEDGKNVLYLGKIISTVPGYLLGEHKI